MQLNLHPFTYAYIYVIPSALPVTLPFSTVAILALAVYHVIGSLVPITVNVSVSYWRILSDVLLSATTFTSTVDDTPLEARIVIVALPVPTALTLPLLFTVATLLLSDANSMLSDVSFGSTLYVSFAESHVPL